MAEITNFTSVQVSKHNRQDSCWIIYHGKVLDVTNYVADLPGGPDLIYDYAGRDISIPFDQIGLNDIALEFLDLLQIGVIEDSENNFVDNDLHKDGNSANGSQYLKQTQLRVDAINLRFVKMSAIFFPIYFLILSYFIFKKNFMVLICLAVILLEVIRQSWELRDGMLDRAGA